MVRKSATEPVEINSTASPTGWKQMAREERWRKRAEEMRALADSMWDPDSKAMMLRMAAEWELLSEFTERLRG